MNNLIRSQHLIRLLQNEIHHRAIARSIQTSHCVRTTESKKDAEETKPDKNKSKPEHSSKSSNGVSTTKNLFGTLAGMKAASSRNVESLHRVEKTEEEENPLLRRKNVNKFDSVFKTAEALNTAITEAAKTVSETFPDKDKTESDLVKQLRRYDEAKAAGERGDVGSISSLLAGMKVQDTKDKSREEIRHARREEPYRDQEKTQRNQMMRQQRVQGDERIERRERTKTGGLKAIRRLGIFSLPEEKTKPDTEVATQDKPPTIWAEHEEKELRELMSGQHRHGFDEMLEWTMDGKLWKYPIDNEQGLEEEQSVGFHEHVLLDDLIADFPKTGPIRDFMELVIVGLSKNPYFTVKQKKEHIDWFRQYFKDKEGVLREAEALPKEYNFA